MNIRETVRQGQDTLARMGLGKERVDRKWDIAVTLQEVRLQYPKSFGEVCLEAAASHLRYLPGWVVAMLHGALTRDERGHLHRKGRTERFMWFDIIPDDFLALRRAMWHRERT